LSVPYYIPMTLCTEGFTDTLPYFARSALGIADAEREIENVSIFTSDTPSACLGLKKPGRQKKEFPS